MWVLVINVLNTTSYACFLDYTEIIQLYPLHIYSIFPGTMLKFIWRSFQNHWRSKGLLFLVPLCFSSSYFSYDFQWYVQRISNATPSRVSITLLDGSPMSFCGCLASSTGAPVGGITGMPSGSPGIFVQGFWVHSIGTSEDECLPGCPACGSSVNFPNSCYACKLSHKVCKSNCSGS